MIHFLQKAAHLEFRVLYLEDDPDDFELVESMLCRQSGGSVSVKRAASFREAQHAIAVATFDLLLVDYQLSEGSQAQTGLDFVRWLDTVNPGLPVMIVSGRDEIDLSGYEDVVDRGVSFLAKCELEHQPLWDFIQRTIDPKKQVLIIDDDPDDRLLVRACLEEHPELEFQIAECANLGQALVMIARDKFDFIVCDYRLGGQASVIDLCSIKYVHPHCGIVLITGQAGLAHDPVAAAIIGRREVAFLSRQHLSGPALGRALAASRLAPIPDPVFRSDWHAPVLLQPEWRDSS